MKDHSPIYSTYANDPVISKVLPGFLQHLPVHLAALRRCVSEGDWSGAAAGCHRLKGTSGGYGYPQLAAKLGELEDLLHQSSPDLQGLALSIMMLTELETRIMLAATIK